MQARSKKKRPLQPLIVLSFHRVESSERLGHKRLRTLMKRSSLWYLPGVHFFFLLFIEISDQHLEQRTRRERNQLQQERSPRKMKDDRGPVHQQMHEERRERITKGNANRILDTNRLSPLPRTWNLASWKQIFEQERFLFKEQLTAVISFILWSEIKQQLAWKQHPCDYSSGSFHWSFNRVPVT